ncbi:MAG: hypothetical protein PHE88_01365 [Elusimicrobia bacterium]|nr:hypothetical protein [Elusimicrobiota bacterium]
MSIKEQANKLANFSYGGTSAIITNISIIIGLGETNVHRSGIIGGLLIIGIADNISDSLGIHIYKESELCDVKESFVLTIFNFITRFLISLSFIFIVLLLPITSAQIISSIWGLSILSCISYIIAKRNKQNIPLELFKHIGIAILVIIASKYMGDFIHKQFS